jgi:hypothetical protein
MKLCFFISCAFLLSTPPSFEVEYEYELQLAESFIAKNELAFVNHMGEDKAQRLFLTAIVFPELVRYSLFRDFFETKALELVYVEYGAEGADFSIGRFQMKPSFVETLEAQVAVSNALALKYGEIRNFTDSLARGIRKERVERLKSLQWQLTYLNCFHDVVSNRFQDVRWQTTAEKLKFYATAYNHNFLASKQELEQWVDGKTYPYGAQYTGPQYAYSDISVSYYNKHIKENQSKNESN